MRVTFAAALALLLGTPAIAQNQNAPAHKASKAEVQKLVDAIKSDKAKMGQFCALQKISEQYSSLSEKDEKKAGELDKQSEEAAKKLGPDFEKVTSSELDDASAALLDELAKSCPK